VLSALKKANQGRPWDAKPPVLIDQDRGVAEVNIDPKAFALGFFVLGGG